MTSLEHAPTAAQSPSVVSARADKLHPLVVLFLISVLIPAGINLGPIYMTGLRMIVLVVTVPLWFMLMGGRFGRVWPSDILLTLYMLWFAISIGVNNPDRMVQFVGSTSLEFLGGYLIARAFIRTRGQFLAFCKFFGVIVICLLPIAVYETLTSRPIVIDILNRLPGVRADSNIPMPQRMGLDRVQAVFPHPILFGVFCSLAFMLNYMALQGVISNARRWVTCAIILFACFLSLSSGAILAVMLQVALFTWYMMMRNVPARWMILFGLSAFCYVVVDLLSNRTPIQVFMSYATFNSSTAYWRGLIFEWGVKNVLGDAALGIPARPLFGIGLDDWVRPGWMHSSSVDNFWLLAAMQSGLPGMLLVSSGYIWALFRVGRHRLDGDPDMLRIRRAWMITMTGLAFSLCTVHVWTATQSFVFFLLGSGFWILQVTPSGGEASETAEVEDAARPTGPRYSRFAPRPRMT